MKNLLLPILLALISFCFLSNAALAQNEKKSYSMVETIYLDIDKSKSEAFEKGMIEHNKKYHSKEPYEARVWAVRTGPRSGSLVWMKGPLTFNDLDNEPDDDGHGKDWRENVTNNCSSTSPTEYWKLKDQFTKASTKQQPIVYVRFLEVNIEDKQGYRMDDLFKKMTETVKAIEGDSFMGVYENLFRQGKMGRHFAIVRGLDKWSELDDNETFRKTFEKVHGEGSHQKWSREMGEVFVDSYDEIWTLTKL